jgi:carotenoid cleavage dioxygenase-like enzyme
MSVEIEPEDILQVRCIHDGGLWCLVARVLDKPPTIVYAVAASLPQANLEFRQQLAKVIDEADRYHEEFPVIAARLTALRWRLEFVEVAR